MGEKSVQKKKFILETARKVFVEKGFKKVTMKDIVEACDISRGGLYLYFDNTSQIFLEVLKLESEEADDVFSDNIKEDATAADILVLFLQEQKKDLEAQTKALAAEIAELDEQLSDAMTEAELDRFSRNGSTFYLKSRLFASPASGRKDEMMQALKENGYGSLVVETVNANTLASFIKEQREATGEDVPAWLGDTVSTYEKVSVGIRKS